MFLARLLQTSKTSKTSNSNLLNQTSLELVPVQQTTSPDTNNSQPQVLQINQSRTSTTMSLGIAQPRKLADSVRPQNNIGMELVLY
jgi:hypothetical protein